MKTTAAIVACLLVTAAGCGSSNAQQSIAMQSTTTASVIAVSLRAGVRAAVIAHHRLSARVLWTNLVPAHPTVIGGPALKNLRDAARTRRKRRIRVKLLSETFRIVAIRLDPSYTTATATITDRQRVRPYGYDGKPLGKSVTLNEDAKVVLHRRGATRHFLVWKVTLT